MIKFNNIETALLRTSLLLLVGLLCCSAGAAEAKNEGNPVPFFEQVEQKGWSVNAWGTPPPSYDLSVVPSRSSAEGRSILRFSILGDEASPATAHLIYPFTFTKDHVYKVSLSLRSAKPAWVTLAVRNDVPPYKIFASKTTKLSPQWAEISIEGINLKGDAPSSVRLIPEDSSAVIEVAGMRIERKDAPSFFDDASGIAVKDDFWGMHVNKLGVHHNWPLVPVKILRLWDTGTDWATLEPYKDKWNFSRLDQYVEFARSHHAAMILTLGQTPSWAASNRFIKCVYRTGCSVPQNKEEWRQYVRKLAQRYGKTIEYWEIWNEPDFYNFWSGTPKEMVELTKIAREEILQSNQKAKIISPSVTTDGGVYFLDRFLAYGGGQYVDLIGVHTYYGPDLKAFSSEIENIKFVLKQHNQIQKPLWNTEGAPLQSGGWTDIGSGDVSTIGDSFLAAKGVFLMLAQGIQNFNYYTWENDKINAKLTSAPFYRDLTQTAQNYKVAHDWLINAVIGRVSWEKGHFMLEFMKNDRHYAVMWADGDRSMHVQANPRYRYVLPMAGKVTSIDVSGTVVLTEKPVLLMETDSL